jgi:hypothetical protein
VITEKSRRNTLNLKHSFFKLLTMFDPDSIIHIPRDPEQLEAFIAELPLEVVEQFDKQWERRKFRDRSEVQELLSPGFKRRLQREKHSRPAKKKSTTGAFGISVYVMPPALPLQDQPKELDVTAPPSQTPSADAKRR